MASCGCKIVNLNISTIKILGVHFSYNRQLAGNMNFVETVNQIENLLGVMFQRRLTLSGRISNKSFIMKTLSSKCVEHVLNILSEKGIIPWKVFKNKYSQTGREHFKWVQLIDAVPKEWKDIIKSGSYEKDPSTILYCSNIVFINQKPISVKKLTSKVIYAELISGIYKKPTAQQNVERKLRSVASQTTNLDWKKICILPGKTVTNTSIRMFQYRLLNNIL